MWSQQGNWYFFSVSYDTGNKVMVPPSWDRFTWSSNLFPKDIKKTNARKDLKKDDSGGLRWVAGVIADSLPSKSANRESSFTSNFDTLADSFLPPISASTGGLPLAAFNLGKVRPYHRGFFCSDDTIRYPFHNSTVTSTVLYSVGLTLPIGCVSRRHHQRLHATHCRRHVDSSTTAAIMVARLCRGLDDVWCMMLATAPRAQSIIFTTHPPASPVVTSQDVLDRVLSSTSWTRPAASHFRVYLLSERATVWTRWAQCF